GYTASPKKFTLITKNIIRPFFQWKNNLGYSAEVTLLQSLMNFGGWTSQSNVRSIASPYNQLTDVNNPLNQLVFEGTNDNSLNNFGNAAKFLGLQGETFDSSSQKGGIDGYKDFMTWVKKEVIKGNQVALGIIIDNGPYDHIVPVIQIESDYSSDNLTWHDDDMLYIDDHGEFAGACNGTNSTTSCFWMKNTDIPYGSENTVGCTPFFYGHSFANLTLNATDYRQFQIFIPNEGLTSENKNFAFSISGVIDPYNVTFPVKLQIADNGSPYHPIAGYNYESPMIAEAANETDIRNILPAPTKLKFLITVTGLTPGNSYNLFRFEYTGRPLLGQLDIPSFNFNANKDKASQVLTFTAKNQEFFLSYEAMSDHTIIYRCVSVDEKLIQLTSNSVKNSFRFIVLMRLFTILFAI
ncbi:hypothetical protein HK099_001402, partial [Clydaea vesicula]